MNPISTTLKDRDTDSEQKAAFTENGRKCPRATAPFMDLLVMARYFGSSRSQMSPK